MKIIYFYHIPKCGGSYIYHLFEKICKKIDGEFVPFINLSEHKKNPQLDEELKNYIGSLKDYSSKKVLIIHHHHGYPGIHELYEEILEAKKAVREKGGEMIVVSTVRDPLSFSISKVNFMQKNGVNLKFDDLITKSYNHNMLSKYLLYNHVDRWQDDSIQVDIPRLEKTISIFDKIFLINEMEQFIQYINDFLNTKKITIKERINAGNLKMLPTEEERKSILELNELDQYFIDFVKRRYLKQSKVKSDKQSFLNRWLPHWVKS